MSPQAMRRVFGTVVALYACDDEDSVGPTNQTLDKRKPPAIA